MRAGTARGLALEALELIEDGAYANLVLPSLLERSPLDRRDRDFVTELTYGVTRMRRACDWLIDRHARGDLERLVRNVLRLGVYQLRWLRVPAHAAVSETVSLAPKRARGLVNAVLRAVARDAGDEWPDLATELSYPDWMVERLEADLGSEDAHAALRRMDVSPVVTTRADGYVQDLASQWVAVAVEPEGRPVVDLCAGPGGKATAMAAGGAPLVVATDSSRGRAGLVAANAARLGRSEVAVVAADGRHPPVRPRSFARVLVDAPCSGLGVLRRRPDARWRMTPEAVGVLARLQRELIGSAVELLADEGMLVYSVCTMTSAETEDVDSWLAERHPEMHPAGPPGAGTWRARGRGWQVLPQDADTDGMFLLRLRRIPDSRPPSR